MTVNVAIVGATGRLGRLVDSVIEASSDFTVGARLDSRSDFSHMLAGDLVVDVSTPKVSPQVVEYALEHEKNVLVGTSGWSADKLVAVEKQLALHEDRGVLVIPNFPLGSALLAHFAAQAARFYDSIEIIEAHHAEKIDSPSGTAVRTAELIGHARQQGAIRAPHADQDARGQLVEGVPIHSVRMQGIIARQDVIFGGTGETLTLTHDTTSPRAYEAGILLALRAAHRAVGLRVGLESLIGLS